MENKGKIAGAGVGLLCVGLLAYKLSQGSAPEAKKENSAVNEAEKHKKMMREMASKGGKASAAKRRAKKAEKEQVKDEA